MAKYISRKAPVAVGALKRKPLGSVVLHHWSSGEVRFTRVSGGWLRVTSERTEVVSSAAVADECNRSTGCKESWARVY